MDDLNYRLSRNAELLIYTRKAGLISASIYLISGLLEAYVMETIDISDNIWIIMTLTSSITLSALSALTYVQFFSRHLEILIMIAALTMSVQHSVYFRSALVDANYYFAFVQMIASFALIILCSTLAISLRIIGIMVFVPIIIGIVFYDVLPYILNPDSLYLLAMGECVAVYYAFFNDKAARTQYQLRLELEKESQHNFELANHDTLANCYNRRYFELIGFEELQRTVEQQEDMSLIIMDIDDFKKINDTYGHPVGDLVIKSIVDFSLTETRPGDITARIGGEEFVVLLPRTPLDEALSIANRLRAVIEKTDIEISKNISLNVSISVGVATLQTDEYELETLLKRADQGLYISKSNGKNCVHSIDYIENENTARGAFTL